MRIDSQDDIRFKAFSRRSVLLGGMQALGFSALLARLYYLQIVRASEYGVLAEENRISVRLLAPLRGDITDRFQTPIASNRSNFRVVLIPEETKSITESLNRLSRIIRVSERKRGLLLDAARRQPGFLPLTVAENLSWRQFARLTVHALDLPGIQSEVGETRHYPDREVAAHIVGYVAPVNREDLRKSREDPLLRLPGFRVGRSGIEQTFDRALRGESGTLRVEINAGGRVLREIDRTPGKQGAQTILTLDMSAQRIATRRLKGKTGSVVVIDVTTGEILVMASQPAFDPGRFNTGLSQKDWDALLGDARRPLVNKAVAGLYPPGSTFKMAVALAALERGRVNPTARVLCEGKKRIGDRVFHCWKEEGHGEVNLRKGLKESCDIYFYDAAGRSGIRAIARMAGRLGLGETFGIETGGEKAGLVPTPAWKRRQRGTAWRRGETLITGIGQGYLLATPLQLAVMTAHIANGVKSIPLHIVSSVGGVAPPRAPLPPRAPVRGTHLARIREAMFAATNEPGGTSYASRLRGRHRLMAGKTGTAQVRRISDEERAEGVRDNRTLDWEERDHALYTAFAPFHKPRYAIAVVVEHGGNGSSAAAPIARDVMAHLLDKRT